MGMLLACLSFDLHANETSLFEEWFSNDAGIDFQLIRSNGKEIDCKDNSCAKGTRFWGLSSSKKAPKLRHQSFENHSGDYFIGRLNSQTGRLSVSETIDIEGYKDVVVRVRIAALADTRNAPLSFGRNDSISLNINGREVEYFVGDLLFRHSRSEHRKELEGVSESFREHIREWNFSESQRFDFRNWLRQIFSFLKYRPLYPTLGATDSHITDEFQDIEFVVSELFDESVSSLDIALSAKLQGNRYVAIDGIQVIGSKDIDVDVEIENASATQSGTSTSVQWDINDPAISLTGFNVYRTVYGEDNFSLLTPSPITETQYQDNSVANGVAYTYKIVVVNTEGDEAHSSTPEPIFVFYNDLVISNFSLERSGLNATLTWSVEEGAQYQIFRAEESGSFALLTTVAEQTTDTATYSDVSLDWKKNYQYYLRALKSFVNPIDGSTVQVESTPSQTLSLSALLPLSVQMSGLDQVEGGYHLFAAPAGDVTLQGTYANAAGDLSITVDYNSGSEAFTATGGSFSLSFQAATTTQQATLTFNDSDADDRAVSLSVTLEIDIYPPELQSVITPVENDTVAPNFEFSLPVTDRGLGVNVNNTLLLIDETPVVASCQLQSEILSCRPASNIVFTKDDLTAQLQVFDFAGNSASTNAISLLADSDGDELEDKNDAYPNDPSRQYLDNVPGVVAQQVNEAVRVHWQAYSDQPLVLGFNIYRQMLDTSGTVIQAYEQLNAEPIDGLNYLDENVINGGIYEYQVVAIGRGDNEGARDFGYKVLVYYNNEPVNGFQAERDYKGVTLSWESVGSELNIVLYRKDGSGNDESGNDDPDNDNSGDDETVINVDTGNLSYLDADLAIDLAATYQVATVRTFINPEGEEVKAYGPRSEPLEVDALKPFELVSIDGGIQQADGSWQLLITSESPFVISGETKDGFKPIDIEVAGLSEPVTDITEEDAFRILVDIPESTQELPLTLTFSEQVLASRALTIPLLVKKDSQAPVLTLENADDFAIDEDFVLIKGTAVDELSGIKQVVLSSDRFGDQTLSAILGQENRFSAEAPLQPGDNNITIRAEDQAGNVTSKTILVRRAISQAPTVEITSPTQGFRTDHGIINLDVIVRSSLNANQLKLIFQEQVYFPTTTADASVHAYSFTNVSLSPGLNRFVVDVESPAGNSQATVDVVHYTVEDTADPIKPSLEITSPRVDYSTSNTTMTITGLVDSEVGVSSVTVNGESAQLTLSEQGDGSFAYTIDLPEGETSVTIVVTDNSGETTTQVLQLVQDNTAPVLTVDNALQPAPDVTPVFVQPFVLSGSVMDEHLSVLTLNGQPINLEPQGNHSYTFSVSLKLSAGEVSPIELVARDSADNQTVLSYQIQQNSRASIEIIAPVSSTYVSPVDGALEEQLIIRAIGSEADDEIFYQISQGSPVAVAHENGLSNTLITLPSDTGDYELTVWLQDSAGNEIARESHEFSVTNNSDIPVELVRYTPESFATGIEPNQFLAFYFNKPIDPQLLTVEVHETVSGMTYVYSDDNKGKPFFANPGAELQLVNRSHDPVPGKLAILPEKTVITFEPTRDIGYEADVYVTVTYDGEELTRHTYKTRSLPTLVQGMVQSIFGEAISGLQVSMPDLGLVTETNNDGAYNFGFDLSEKEDIGGGRHKIVINPSLKNRRFGEVTLTVNLQEGRLNKLSKGKVPLLSDDIPFQRISSGQEAAVLAATDLTLNLSDVDLEFPDLRDRGDVHVQFLPAQQVAEKSLDNTRAIWYYAAQPQNIKVRGNLQFTMVMPRLRGDYEYLPAEGALLLVYGYDSARGLLVPQGVAQMNDNFTASTVGVTEFESLNYIGANVIPPAQQYLLQEYLDGTRTLNQIIQDL